jgi:2-amino-4-hydroxy-6-hydroxymethyldihydropteridine diphosphokinase
MNGVLHKAYLLLGSNIEPEVYIRLAIQRLGKVVRILAISTAWETQAVGSTGPNFLNAAVEIVTELDASELKNSFLRPIEQELGRTRSSDKNAPRTIDIDIIIFDGEVCDANLWLDIFRAIPVAELLPDLRQPQTGMTLNEAAKRLQQNSFAIAHPELNNLSK